VVAAVAAGEMRLEALVRGSYPGRRMPDCVLPQVSTIGYWDAVRGVFRCFSSAWKTSCTNPERWN